MSRQLSKDFTSNEFACPCCKKRSVSPALIILLQKLRDWVGEPIHISKGGGVRCEKYNKKIGGYDKSAHINGEAVDIHCYETDIYKLALMSNLLKFPRIGIAPFSHYIHVDVVKPHPSKYWVYDKTGFIKYFKSPKTIDDVIYFCELLSHGQK